MIRSPKPRRIRFVSLVVPVALLSAACGGSDGATIELDADETTSTTEADPVDNGDGDGDDEISAGDDTDQPADTVTTTESSAPAAEGEPLDFGPTEGQPLNIVNVRYDDVLNFRAGPGTDAEIVLSIAPLAEGNTIVAAGEAWAFERSVWWKVTVAGEEVWANQSFLGMLGDSVSVFDDVSAELASLEAATLEELALAVADTRWLEEPAPTIEIAGEPTAADAIGGFTIVDLVGFLDDSVKGERLEVVVDFVLSEDESEPSTVVLVDVVATPICARGVDQGLCL